MDYNQNRKFWLLKKYERSSEVRVWDGLVLIRRGAAYMWMSLIYSDGAILSKTYKVVRHHEHDFWGTTLWSIDTKAGDAVSIEGTSSLRCCCSQIGYPLFRKHTTRNTGKNFNGYYQHTTIFGEGSIQKDRSARFTGKPYDKNLQAYVFSNKIYNPIIKI